MGAIEPHTVLGQSCQIVDAEIAAARGPVFIVWSGLSQIIEPRPHEFAYHPGIQVLHHPVIIGQIAPVADGQIVAAHLSVGVHGLHLFRYGELIYSSA